MRPPALNEGDRQEQQPALLDADRAVVVEHGAVGKKYVYRHDSYGRPRPMNESLAEGRGKGGVDQACGPRRTARLHARGE